MLFVFKKPGLRRGIGFACYIEACGLAPSKLAIELGAGVSISAISGNTAESGTVALFTVKLNSEPTHSVTLPVTSSDTTEGLISVDGTNYRSTDNLSFLTSNWYQDKTVQVQGQNDYTLDGDQSFTVQLGTMVSDDPNYRGIDPLDMPLTNIEDVFGGLVINTNSGETSEEGEKATFSVRLANEPDDNVFGGWVVG